MADRTQADDIDWALLGRAFAGELTPEARAAFDHWVRADRMRTRLVETLRAEWDRSAELPLLPAAEGSIDRSAALQALRQHMGAAATVSHPYAAPPGRRRGMGGGFGSRGSRRFIVAAASMVAVALGVGLAVRHLPSAGPQILSSTGHEYATAAGRRLSVTLVDGTQLTLAPASRVRIAPDFGVRTRELELDGEAYFAVVHDAARPFTVRARTAVLRDVGTHFDVRAYAEDAVARVAVVEGSVVVALATGSRQDQFLYAGDVATAGATRLAVTHGVNVSALTAWTQGGLAFEDTPLREAVLDIGRAFGVAVIVADSTLAGKRVTATFRSESLDEVLDVVTQALGARFERAGRTVLIRRGLAGVRRRESGGPGPITTAQASGTRG